jgi:copper homeostasis protein
MVEIPMANRVIIEAIDGRSSMITECSSVMLEICIDSVASAKAAAVGGANRVELCAGLPEGGTTPSSGMIRSVRSVFGGGLMVIIRPRGYDFLYSEDEMDVMLHDIEMARSLGADGIVIGCLNPDGTVDKTRCSRLLEAAGPLDVTFHRAFDMSRDLGEAMEDIIGLGIKRILTSGGHPDVPAGAAIIRNLVASAKGRVSLMPGGGITVENIGEMVRATDAREIHLSARRGVNGGMVFRNPNCFMGTFTRDNEYGWREANAENVRRCKEQIVACLKDRGL